MKKILVLFSFFCLFFNFSGAYQEVLIEERGGKAIRVIKVVLDGEHFIVSAVAKDGGETLEALTKKVGWVSAINGAFFCPKDYSYCNGQTFSNYERIFQGDGASFSRFRPDTSVRGIFGFTKDWLPMMVQNKISVQDIGLESNINADKINDLYFWISNFPVLLIEWEDVTAGASEYIDSKLTWKWNRNFICSTKDWKTIYMGYIGSSSVRDMAPYLRKNFDCWNALSLDAGASSAMVYSGQILDKWERSLITDAFVVVPKSSYVVLWWEVPSSPAIADGWYVLTDGDWQKIKKLEDVIDLIYKKYWKAVYKDKLISMFRKEVSKSTLSEQKKAVYNQVLIWLFSLWSL